MLLDRRGLVLSDAGFGAVTDVGFRGCCGGADVVGS